MFGQEEAVAEFNSQGQEINSAVEAWYGPNAFPGSLVTLGSSATLPSYAVMTSRSYHAGNLVNVVLMDGSVRSVTSTISLATWRALGTRNGGEVIGSDF